MGLHISRIEVTNFRNFRHLLIDPFPSQAVIVGENGTGKSNLLHALRLILDPTLSDAARMLRSEDVWEGHSKGLAGGATVSISLSLAGFDDDDDAKAVLGSAIVEVAPYEARLTYRFSPRTEVVVSSTGDGQPKVEEEERPLTTQDYDFVVFGGLDETTDVRRIRRDVGLRVLHALRDAETDLQNWRRNPLRELLERLPLDPDNLAKTATAVADAVKQLTEDGNVSVLQAHLEDRLRQMVGPRMPLEPTLGFASTQPDELIRAVRLFVDKEARHGIGDTSLGSANVIYLGLLIEALAQQRDQDLFVSTLLAVEEPEAHLHVALQRRLFKYLLRSEQGLMLTTHSPHIAAVAPLGSFVLLRSTDQGTVGSTTAGLKLGSAVSQDIERYLDVSRAEVLFATCVILVEGIAEAYVLPALAAALDFDLDSYGVVVSSVHGADFAPYRKLLGIEGLGTPHVVITDGDASGTSTGTREAGLRRGARLHADSTCVSELLARIDDLPEQDEDEYEEKRSDIVRAVAQDGVFVGRQTLETDLCRLFGKEMEAAFSELRKRQSTREKFAAEVANELTEAPDEKLRARMLKRITALGKGRYAQRLAAHLEALDLRSRLHEDMTLVPADADASAALSDVSSGWHVLAALDQVSRIARGVPLFEPAADSTDGVKNDDGPQ